MYIKDILNEGASVSFEIFPPKKDTMLDSMMKTIEELVKLNPGFISVTYGAGGGTSKNTVKIASDIQNNKNVTALAHLTCASSTKEYVSHVIDELKNNNIENILALRGDKPIEYTEYRYAYELIAKLKQERGFCIGGACYPEGHPESGGIEDDLNYLKMKVDTGCDFLITQLFFDNSFLYDYADKISRKKIDVPLVLGMMPVQGARQIKKMCELSGSTITEKLEKLIVKYADNDADMAKAGIEYVIEQINDLWSNGFRYYHIYTMNKSAVAETIINAIRQI